ncbi:MAG TPA: class I SAM-dependent methyltransferase [Bacteroidota bacterium]|nr:class I SAM-dependent methyltransferase [Bacteroidota bacterium]
MTTCPLCHETVARDFPIFYEFNAKKYQAKECRVCSFVFLDPRLSDEDLRVLYSDEYFLHDGADFGAHAATDYETAAIKGSVKFPEILGRIRRFKPSGEFFEIGCGMGYFLNFAKQNGYSVSGIEYARLGVRSCRDKFGLDVRQGSIEDFTVTPEAFDVVFMGDVLEHLIQPLEMLTKVHEMLKPSGVAALEVPAMFNSLAGRAAVAGMRLLGKNKKMMLPPYHVNEFAPKTLRSIIKRAGFRDAVIVQRIKPPSAITLRGSAFEKSVKKTLHYPNYGLTKSLGVFGDRLLGIGIK